MKVLKTIWDHLEEFFLLPALAFSVCLIFAQVVMRYVFHNSLSWSEELARYLYVWITWVGVSYSAHNGTHLRITMIKDRLPKGGQHALELFITIIWVCFGIFICIQGLSAIQTIASFGQKSSALRIPMQYCYFSIPVGMVLMCIRLIESAIKSFKKNTEGGDK